MRKLLHAASIAALVSLAATPVTAQDQGADPCALLSGLKDSGKDASDLFSQCVSKSKEIELEPGIYSFYNAVSVSANGVAISTKGRSPDSPPCSAQLGVRCAVFAPGAGFSASGKPTQEKGKSASPALVRVSGKDVALHHIEFDGMGSAETKQSGSLLSIGSGATGTTVLAAEFRNWNGDAALSLVGAKNVSVAGSRFRSNGSQASLTSHINVKGGSGVKLSQNLLQDSSKFGINISGCADCEAQRNVLWQSGSGKASAIVAIRAVGDTLTVRNNYVDCDVFWCNAAYFFGKSGEKAAANGAEASTITARNNVASHALAGFFFGLGSTIKAEDNLALAKAGGFSCGKRASAPFSKLTGASVEAQGRAPAIVEASFSAKGLSEQERSTCVVGTAEKQRATGDEKVLRAVAQTVFPFMLGRAPTKDERSATASQLAAGASLKELFIGLDVLKSPEPASGEVTIMANKGGGKDPEGAGTQRADRGEKMGSSAVGGPTVTIASTTTSVASTSSIVATFRFSRQVTGFGFADITATNATFQAMTPSNGVGTIFTVTLRPTVVTSDVTLAVAADKALGFLAPKIGNQASSAFTIPTAYARSTLRLSDSASGPFSGPREICIQASKDMIDEPSFNCTNCTVSNFQGGCGLSTGSEINYSAIVNPSASASSVTVTIPEQLGRFVLASSNSLSWSVAPTPTPAPPTVFTAPRLFGTSTLKASTSPISIKQFHFGLRLPLASSGRVPNSWSIFVQSSASSPSSNLSQGGAAYGYGGSDGTVIIWPEHLGLSQSNRYLPCANLRLVPEFQYAPNRSPIYGSPIFISGCETLIAQNSANGNNGRILLGLFNAPYGTAGERPIDVEYSVVNSNPVAGDISQQVFPPYTVAALNFNSAGAAQRDFQTTGPAPCFLVKWRFSFPNGVYSPPETRLFCQGGPTDLYQD
jgi:hypothetical protein